MRTNVILDGKEYAWDGQVYYDENKARTSARKYLRWGFDVHIEKDNDRFYVLKFHPFRGRLLSDEDKP